MDGACTHHPQPALPRRPVPWRRVACSPPARLPGCLPTVIPCCSLPPPTLPLQAYAVAANQLAGDTTEVSTAAGQTITVQAFLEGTYGYKASFAWPAIGILVGFLVGFRAISTLAVRFLTFQSR